MSLKSAIACTLGIIIGVVGTAKYAYHPTLESYCGNPPEVMLQLQSKGLAKGTFYLKCKDKTYKGELEVVSHEYTGNNSHVRVYGNYHLKSEDFEIEGNI